MRYGVGKTILATLGILVLAAGAWAAPGKEAKVPEAKWLTDWAKAKELATKHNRPILINFSGSDWCGWCHKLEGEVFSKDAFLDYAKKNLVLFVADFPRSKPQKAEVKEQNAKLAKQYGIRGFPTILLVDSAGKALAQTGYQRGGAEKYVEHLKGLLAGSGN